MPKFSANLGFLWKDLPLPDAILAAARADFDAVECHWPNQSATDVREALNETGLTMLGINTRRGSRHEDMGLAAVPGREAEARDDIDAAIGYAADIGAGHVHVLAGAAEGAEAEDAFLSALQYACLAAAPHGIRIVIEPLNARDNPGYALRDTDQAARLIAAVNRPELSMMFDCYHVALTEGAVIDRLERHLPLIGHIQIAGVPERSSPDRGDLDYTAVFAAIDALGWTRPLGAEYRPDGVTEASLGWMTRLRGLNANGAA